MTMLPLPHSRVQLGAPLPWNVYEGSGVLLLRRGHIVYSQHQLELLLERGVFVDAAELAAERETPASALPAVTVPQTLFDLWEHTTAELSRVIALAADPAQFVPQLQDLVRHVMQLLDRNPEFAIYRAVRQDQAKTFYYGYDHAVHAAVMSILLSRQLGWANQQVMSLASAALTMNMTILDLQGRMAGQDVPMRDKQRLAIHAHPLQACQLLTDAGVRDEQWLTAIAQHHERPDGSGYPLGINEVAQVSVALRVCDVLVAKISPRVLRQALLPQEAALQLFREDKGGPLSAAMIHVLGIHPPGDFVQLASGELGVVVQRTSNVRAPIVAVIADRAGHPTGHTVRRDSAEPAYAITGNASNRALVARLPPERLYGFSAFPQSAAPPH